MSEVAVPAQEVTRTYDCCTAGCEEKRRRTPAAPLGLLRPLPGEPRNGTARRDPEPPRPDPHRAGSKARKGGKAPVKRTATSPPAAPRATTPNVVSPNGDAGQYEERVAALAAAARELDLALEAYRAAKPALEQAAQK